MELQRVDEDFVLQIQINLDTTGDSEPRIWDNAAGFAEASAAAVESLATPLTTS